MTTTEPAGKAKEVLDLIRNRGGLAPSHAGAVTTVVAAAAGVTPQRALQILRQLDHDGHVVIERYTGRPARIAKVRLP